MFMNVKEKKLNWFALWHTQLRFNTGHAAIIVPRKLYIKANEGDPGV